MAFWLRTWLALLMRIAGHDIAMPPSVRRPGRRRDGHETRGICLSWRWPPVEAFLDREFPEIRIHGRHAIESRASTPLGATVRMAYHASQLRPGGTISGPAMMALADLALYVAILGSIGPVGLAVTTNLSYQLPAQARREAP